MEELEETTVPVLIGETVVGSATVLANGTAFVSLDVETIGYSFKMDGDVVTAVVLGTPSEEEMSEFDKLVADRDSYDKNLFNGEL